MAFFENVQLPRYEAPNLAPFVHPSALAQFAKGAVSTYGTLSQLENQRRQLAMQQQHQAEQLGLQRQQQALDVQKAASLAKLQGIQGQEVSAQIAHQHLSDFQTKQSALGSGLADVGYLPSSQRESAYQDLRNKMITHAGISPDELPEQYNNLVAQKVSLAMQHSPASSEQRAFQQKAALQVLKDRGATAAALAKAGVVPGGAYQVPTAPGQAGPLTPAQKSFQTEEGKKNSDYFDDLSSSASGASTIIQDVQSMRGIAGQIPSEFGVVRGGKVFFTPKGQALVRVMNKMILDKYEGMKHIGKGGNLMITTIKSSKPGAVESLPAFMHTLNAYEGTSRLLIEKNKFGNTLKGGNIHDRNRLQNIWDEFQSAYPMVDSKGNFHPESASQWAKFLHENPHILSSHFGAMGKRVGGAGTFPRGFNQPGVSPQQSQGQPVSAPQTAAPVVPQATPQSSWSYDQSNPYDQ